VVPVIEARGVSKRYGDRAALSGVTFEARRGEVVACIGPNGAGKTTLLTILAEIQQPDSGTVRRTAGRVGWVPQEPGLYGKLTVAENLRLFARLDGVTDVEDRVAGLIARSGLEDRAGEQVSRLSAGNRQRVNIAIGLLSTPELLLMDEPSAGIDPRQRTSLWAFVGELMADGTTVVYATHDISEAERYSDRILVLADGQGLFWGTAEGLLDAVGRQTAGRGGDLETAFVAFLRERGH